MRSPARMLVLVLAMVAALAASPAPSHAATINRNVVYVEDHTGSAWPVHSTTYWADYLSGASVHYGGCRSAYRCIKVYEKTIRSSWAAVTYVDWSTGRTTIYVNPTRNWYSYAKRNNIIHHEMGHAFCLLHTWRHPNLMYPYVSTSLYLAPSQKTTFHNCR